MKQAPSIDIRWSRILCAIALVYLIALKSLFAPFPLPVAPGTGSGFNVICLHDVATAVDDEGNPAPAGQQNSCCDDGCLLRLAALNAPSDSVSLFATLFPPVAILRLLHLERDGLSPPGLSPARPQAPRAPPVS